MQHFGFHKSSTDLTFKTEIYVFPADYDDNGDFSDGVFDDDNTDGDDDDDDDDSRFSLIASLVGPPVVCIITSAL